MFVMFVILDSEFRTRNNSQRYKIMQIWGLGKEIKKKEKISINIYLSKSFREK